MYYQEVCQQYLLRYQNRFYTKSKYKLFHIMSLFDFLQQKS